MKIRRKRKRFSLMLLAPLLVALGGGIIYLGIQSDRQFSAAKHWPTVDGEIVESRIDLRRERSGGKTRRKRIFVVRYEYNVNNTMYEGSRLAFGTYGTNDLAVLLKRYPEGKQVRVVVNPNEPEISSLNVGEGSPKWTFFIVGGTFIAISVYFVSKHLSTASLQRSGRHI